MLPANFPVVRFAMLNFHPNSQQTRLPAPIPGVPDSQAKALDRRLRLHRQMQSFRRSQADNSTNPVKTVNDPDGPGQA